MTETIEAKTSNMQTNSALPPEETERLGGEIVAALKTVFDPEIPADIYELGLIYKVDIKDDRTVDVEMTLTTPNCPAAGELPTMVENAVASVPGVGLVNVNRVGAGLDPGSDVRRGAPRPEYVVSVALPKLIRCSRNCALRR